VVTGTRLDEEASMKKLKYFCLAIAAFSLLAIPAAAQKGRSNKGGAERGDARADLVQSENKKKDKDRDRNPDNDKNKGKHKGETQGKHKAKGHRH
jgi:Ni/Co efflux regulator RcnB